MSVIEPYTCMSRSGQTILIRTARPSDALAIHTITAQAIAEGAYHISEPPGVQHYARRRRDVDSPACGASGAGAATGGGGWQGGGTHPLRARQQETAGAYWRTGDECRAGLARAGGRALPARRAHRCGRRLIHTLNGWDCARSRPTRERCISTQRWALSRKAGVSRRSSWRLDSTRMKCSCRVQSNRGNCWRMLVNQHASI